MRRWKQLRRSEKTTLATSIEDLKKESTKWIIVIQDETGERIVAMERANAKKLEDFRNQLTSKFQTLQTQCVEKMKALETFNKKLVADIKGYTEVLDIYSMRWRE